MAAQPLLECHAGLDVNRDLADPLQVILDRVFHRDDIEVRAVNLLQGCIQGRGLARARGAGHQEYSIGRTDQFAEPGANLFRHAQLFQREHTLFFLQDTHDHALAVMGRQG